MRVHVHDRLFCDAFTRKSDDVNLQRLATKSKIRYGDERALHPAATLEIKLHPVNLLARP